MERICSKGCSKSRLVTPQSDPGNKIVGDQSRDENYVYCSWNMNARPDIRRVATRQFY